MSDILWKYCNCGCDKFNFKEYYIKVTDQEKFGYYLYKSHDDSQLIQKFDSWHLADKAILSQQFQKAS